MADTTITLDVQAASSPPNGYSPCGGPAGYFHQYSGGNVQGKPGNFAFTHGTGNKSIDISLSSAANRAGFEITNISAVYDTRTDPADLLFAPKQGNSGTWTVTDSDVDQESGCFVVIVSNGNVTGITCDPRWQNN